MYNPWAVHRTQGQIARPNARDSGPWGRWFIENHQGSDRQRVQYSPIDGVGHQDVRRRDQLYYPGCPLGELS